MLTESANADLAVPRRLGVDDQEAVPVQFVQRLVNVLCEHCAVVG